MGNHIGPVVATNDSIKAIDCQPCGYVHLDPLPTQVKLDKLYADEYYQEYNAGWFEKERREQWYWFAVYNQRLVYAEFLFAQAEMRRLTQKKRMMRVFDYGAGCGWFVKLAESFGHQYFGYEPNEAARWWAADNLGIELEDHDVMNSWDVFKDGPQWDFVHASLVLEHLLNPMEFLIQAYASLKPSGVLCIIVPNEFNLYQQKLKDNYSPLHEHHLNYFTPHSLKALCETAGFEIVRHTSTFPIEWFALHGLNYVKYPRLGKIAHWLRMAIEWGGLALAPERWERLRDEWAKREVGREIELWLRKT